MTSTDSTQDKDLLERYRRAGDAEAAAPSEAVRAAILAEGRRVAAERATQAGEHRIDPSRPAANDSRWKITAFGTAGAALLAALIFAPRYWESTQLAPMHAESAPAALQAPTSELAKSERAPTPESADAAPAAQSAEEPAAPAPRKDLRIVRERPRAEPIAPAASPPVRGGARSMSADRMTASPAQVAPLLSAVASGDLAEATELLDQGAPVDARDALGRTALMLAVARGRLDVVRLLLDRGADPNAADNAGQTVLRQAEQQNMRDVVVLLERAGAH